jgi:hypothetical protein
VLRRAGIEQFSASPDRVETWKQAGFTATPLSEEEWQRRVKLLAPGIDRRVRVASATTAPWVNANGWRIRREPGRDFRYELPAGSAPLAAAEAFTYEAKAVLKIDPSDIADFGEMLGFLRSIPERSLPDIVDFGFVDDGSDTAGEQLNLLSRRNLLFRIVKQPDSQLRFNVAANSDNPNLFAAKIRERLKDEQRSLRVYGSEVVVCRMTSNGKQTRIYLLNYGRRRIDGVRLRVRGSYSSGKVYAVGSAKGLEDMGAADGFTEFTVRDLGVYAVVDLGD